MLAVVENPLDQEVPRRHLAILLKHFADVGDDREPWRVMYPLKEVLLLLTCATIAALDAFDDICAWGRHHLDSAHLLGVSFRHSVRALDAQARQPGRSH